MTALVWALRRLPFYIETTLIGTSRRYRASSPTIIPAPENNEGCKVAMAKCTNCKFKRHTVLERKLNVCDLTAIINNLGLLCKNFHAKLQKTTLRSTVQEPVHKNTILTQKKLQSSFRILLTTWVSVCRSLG